MIGQARGDVGRDRWPGRSVRPLGDSALVVDTETTGDARALARALSTRARGGASGGTGLSGLEDVVTGFRSVTAVADPDVADMDALAEAMATVPFEPGSDTGGHQVAIPVEFDGPDLDDVARLSGLTRDGVVALLEATALEVAFVGFAPGFGYLVGLPGPLADVPRRDRPRPAVPAGSVALGGGFAGVYPAAMPGGWQLVGRTGMTLFRPDVPPYALLAPGDTVRLVSARVGRASHRRARSLLVAGPTAPRLAVIEEPGLFTVVQDFGRVGVASMGVPRAGAADPDSLELANRLVGNDPTAAGLECTARGPTMRLRTPAHVAVVGDAVVRLDGRSVPSELVLPVERDQVLEVGEIRGSLRSYVAVDGGIRTPIVLGSRSSDVLCGLGPGRLVTGDELGIGPPARPHGRLRRPPPDAELPRLLRVVAGPDDFPADALDRLCAQTWTVGDASDRVGLRLTGAPIPGPAPTAASRRSSSRGVVTGTVQIPPDGIPIVLSCDHATVGGYPVPAVVVRADLGVLGRCRPGDPVRFEAVDLVGAARLRAERRRRLESQVMGWFPTRSD